MVVGWNCSTKGYTGLNPLTGLFTKIVAIAASVYQDQAAHFVQPDLRSTLSAILEHWTQKISKQIMQLPLSLYSCRVKVSIGFILHF